MAEVAAMRVHDSLDTCLLEVLEHAANDDCIVRQTKHPRKKGAIGQLLWASVTLHEI